MYSGCSVARQFALKICPRNGQRSHLLDWRAEQSLVLSRELGYMLREKSISGRLVDSDERFNLPIIGSSHRNNISAR